MIPIHKAIPSDHHPSTLRGPDDLPTRAGVSALTDLYTTWSTLADLEGQLTNKAKMRDRALKDMTAALGKSEAVVKHLNEVAANHTKAIKNAITSKRTRYDAELRAHYKGKPSEALKGIADAEVAAALYDVPAVLLGFTEEQVALLRNQIEMTHVSGDYHTRASAIRAATKLEAARERFGQTWMTKARKWDDTDDAVLARSA